MLSGLFRFLSGRNAMVLANYGMKIALAANAII